MGTPTAEYLREWRKRNPGKHAAYQRRYRAKHPKEMHAAYITREYGITKEEYKTLFEKQAGVCAICLNTETATYHGKVIQLAVDHDHNTNAIRGLLCRDCNIVLGLMRDDVKRLEAAITYLKEKMNGGTGD